MLTVMTLFLPILIQGFSINKKVAADIKTTTTEVKGMSSKKSLNRLLEASRGNATVNKRYKITPWSK